MTITNMQDQINLLTQQQAKTNELLAQQQAMIKILLARLDKSHLFLKPGKQLTPEENYQETLQGSINLIREGIEARSWEMIESLTSEWSQDYKKEVSKHLNTEEKTIIKRLSELYKVHLKSATEAYNQASASYVQAVSDIAYQMPSELIAAEKPAVCQSDALPRIQVALPRPEAKLEAKEQKPEPTYTGWGVPSVSIGVEIIDRISTPTDVDTEESEARKSIFPSW